MIRLLITDSISGKVTVVQQKPHDARKLYLALHELFGDSAYGKKPVQLITVPDVSLSIKH